MILAVDRLNQMIDREFDPGTRACLTAEMVLYIAREGKFDQAREIVHDLRIQFNRSVSLTLTCWLCLLDGVVLFHEKPDSNSFDRIRRAYQLSRSIATSKVGVLSTAWFSHLELNRGRLLESVILSAEALRCANKSMSGPLSRIALTIADMFSYCGDSLEASEWYAQSRKQALVDGDRLGVSAALHNIAALRVHALSLAKFCQVPEPPSGTWIELELNSSRNYDAGIELLSLSSLEPIIRAQLLILYGRFSEALSILERSVVSLERDGLIRYRSIILADQLLCKVKLSVTYDVDVDVHVILEALERTTDHDDRALVFGLLSTIFESVSNEGEARRFWKLTMEEVATYRCGITSLIERAREARLDFESWKHLYSGG
jgi:hypothetical protein